MRKPDALNEKPWDQVRLRQKLGITGLTQQQISDRIGISRRLLTYYLNGTHTLPYPVQYTIQGLIQ